MQVTLNSKTYAERHFKVFSTPDVHLEVVGAEFVEILTIDDEKPSSNHWRPVWDWVARSYDTENKRQNKVTID